MLFCPSATHSRMENADKRQLTGEVKSISDDPEKSSSTSKSSSKSENDNEVVSPLPAKEESIESLREEIDQLLAPIISNQVCTYDRKINNLR